jgi:hypothetical protein
MGAIRGRLRGMLALKASIGLRNNSKAINESVIYLLLSPEMKYI